MKKLFVVLAVIVISLALSGCAMADDGIPGRYEAKVVFVPIFYVELNSDGTYSEGTIMLGQDTEIADGTWSAAGNTVTIQHQGFSNPSIIVIENGEFDYDGFKLKKQ